VQELAEFCSRYGIDIVHITPACCDTMRQLPFIHSDPFDRIIIATAKDNDYTILTKDGIIPKYDIRTVW